MSSRKLTELELQETPADDGPKPGFDLKKTGHDVITPEDGPNVAYQTKDNKNQKVSRSSPSMQTSVSHEEAMASTRIFPGATAMSGVGEQVHQESGGAGNPPDADDENPPDDDRRPTQSEETLAVAAYVSFERESEPFSDPSTSVVYGVPMTKRNKWLIAITILLVILVGAVVAVAVILTKQSNSSASSVSVQSPRSPDSPVTPVPPPVQSGMPTAANGATGEMTPMPTNSQPAPILALPTAPTMSAFANSIQLQDYTLTESGGYKVEVTNDTVATESTCLDVCVEYDAVRWASYESTDKCVCYSLIPAVTHACATPWGNNVGDIYGTVYSKQPLTACGADFCASQPNDALCFTGNTLSSEDYTLIEDGGYTVNATDAVVTTDTECLAFCAEYDAVKWLSYADSDNCVCYSLVVGAADTCVTAWGNRVDATTYVGYGTIYSKKPFTTCSNDFCSSQPNDALCFTANRLDFQKYTLIENGGYTVNATNALVTSELECLAFCADLDAARWLSYESSEKCVCYSLIPGSADSCATPWGDRVYATSTYVPYGTIYSKLPFTTCSNDFCTSQPNDALCFTANTLDVQKYVLTESGGYAVNSTNALVTSELQCLAFCDEFDAAKWLPYAISDKCVCYSLIAGSEDTCATPWGNRVDTSAMPSGMIYSKQPFATCGVDFCTSQPNDALCFTANTLDYQVYTLIEDGGYLLNATNDVVTSELGCLAFCGDYDAARWLSYVESDKCVCYSLIAGSADTCATPWGNRVDATTYVGYGNIYSKLPFATCSVDYCTSQSNDALCFTANTLDNQLYTLIEDGGYTVSKTGDLVTSEFECLAFCADAEAVRWLSYESSDKCVCYSLISGARNTCATPWGDRVDAATYVPYGLIYSKQPFSTCSDDFCTSQPRDGLCFTANALDFQAYTLIEDGGFGVNTTSSLVTSVSDCLAFCANYDAVKWLPYASTEQCACYSLIEGVADPCATPWGSQVETASYVESGTIFAKKPFATCSFEFCDVDSNNTLCTTTN